MNPLQAPPQNAVVPQGISIGQLAPPVAPAAAVPPAAVPPVAPVAPAAAVPPVAPAAAVAPVAPAAAVAPVAPVAPQQPNDVLAEAVRYGYQTDFQGRPENAKTPEEYLGQVKNNQAVAQDAQIKQMQEQISQLTRDKSAVNQASQVDATIASLHAAIKANDTEGQKRHIDQLAGYSQQSGEWFATQEKQNDAIDRWRGRGALKYGTDLAYTEAAKNAMSNLNPQFFPTEESYFSAVETEASRVVGQNPDAGFTPHPTPQPNPPMVQVPPPAAPGTIVPQASPAAPAPQAGGIPFEQLRPDQQAAFNRNAGVLKRMYGENAQQVFVEQLNASPRIMNAPAEQPTYL